LSPLLNHSFLKATWEQCRVKHHSSAHQLQVWWLLTGNMFCTMIYKTIRLTVTILSQITLHEHTAIYYVSLSKHRTSFLTKHFGFCKNGKGVASV
jgi:hypothetical protein